MDLTNYLKAIPPAKDPQDPKDLVGKLCDVCETLVLAQSVVHEMMKR